MFCVFVHRFFFLTLAFIDKPVDDNGHRSVVSVDLLPQGKCMLETAENPRGYHVLENANKSRLALSVHL